LRRSLSQATGRVLMVGTMWTAEIIVLVTITFLCAGFVKGAIGLGIPVVALAFMAAPLGLKAAMAIIVAPCIVANVWQGLAGSYFGEIMRRLWAYLAAGCIGTWFGVGVLAGTSGELLLGLLGVVLCVYSTVSLLRPQIPPPGEREAIYSPIAGGLGGIMFGMTGTFIVPGILYLQALGFGRDALVQAMGVTFAVITAALAVSFTSRDLFPLEIALLSAFAVVPTGAGWLLGRRYRARISERQFRTFFFSALVVVGVYMVIRAAT
jgi:hypothetical protein